MNKISINYSDFHSYNLFTIDLSKFDVVVLEIFKSVDCGWAYKVDTAQGVVVMIGCEELMTAEEFSKKKISIFKCYPYIRELDRYITAFFSHKW